MSYFFVKPTNEYSFPKPDDRFGEPSECWGPEQNDIFHGKSTSKKGEEVAKAIMDATKLRTHDFLGDTEIMLSSGVDSRSLLFSMHDPKATHCFTIYETENNELRYAHEIAMTVLAKQTLIKRDADYAKDFPMPEYSREYCR